MKKITPILAIFLLAAPAMAAVSISITDNADLTATISYTDDGDPNYVLAFALDITVDNDANITGVDAAMSGDCNSTEQEYDIFLVSFRKIDAGGVTIEIVSLYEDANSPPLSAPLCTVTVDKACNMTVAVNEDGGGVVLEDANSITPDLSAATGVAITGGCTCLGDLSGDGVIVNVQDFYMLLGKLNYAYAQTGKREILFGDPAWNDCADMSGDGLMINVQDFYMLLGNLGRWCYDEDCKREYLCPYP